MVRETKEVESILDLSDKADKEKELLLNIKYYNELKRIWGLIY